MPITQDEIRELARMALACVALAFKLYRLFDPLPDATKNPRLAKKREEIIEKVGELNLLMVSVLGQGLEDCFRIANARSGRSERIVIGQNIFGICHWYAPYLLDTVAYKEHMLPFDCQLVIEEEIRAEGARALAWLDLMPVEVPTPLSKNQSAKIGKESDSIPLLILAAVDKAIYDVKGLIEEYKGVRGGYEPRQRVSLEERNRILGKSRYLLSSGIRISPEPLVEPPQQPEAGPKEQSPKASKHGSGGPYLTQIAVAKLLSEKRPMALGTAKTRVSRAVKNNKLTLTDNKIAYADALVWVENEPEVTRAYDPLRID